MKKISWNLTILAALSLLWSCGLGEMDPLEGKYAPPTDSQISTLASVERTMDGNGMRHFTIRLEGGSDVLVAELVGAEYYLTANTYTPTSEQLAGVNTYVLEHSSYNNSPLTRGTITVQSEDGVNYVFSGIVWAESGAIVRFKAKGYQAFEPDIVVVDPVVCPGTVSVIPLQGNIGGGWGPIPGCFEVMVTAKAEDGSTLAFLDLYTASETEFSGTYTVAEGVYEQGIANNGWIWDGNSGGTVIYSNGVSYMVKSGEIEVVDTPEVMTVSCYGARTEDADGNQGPVNFVYEIHKEDAPAPPVDETLYKVSTHGKVLKAEDHPWTQDGNGNWYQVEDVFEYNVTAYDMDNVIAVFSLYAGDVQNLSGEYEIADGRVAPGLANNGWNSASSVGGGSYLTKDGTAYLLKTGILTVEENDGQIIVKGEGIYTVSPDGKQGPVNFQYTLSKAEVDPSVPIDCEGTFSSGELWGNPNGEWIIIENVFNTQIVATRGGETLASFELYTASDIDYSGTYRIAESTFEAGIANNGWVWGESAGGCVFTRAGVTYMLKAGELTVEDDGKTVTIRGEGLKTQDGNGNPGPEVIAYSISRPENPYAVIECEGTTASGELWGNPNGEWIIIQDVFNTTITAYDGETKLASFELYTASDTDYTGTYRIAESTYEAGIANNGWVWGDSAGGCVVIKSGTTYMLKEGTLNIQDDGSVITIEADGITTVDNEGNAGPEVLRYQITRR